MKLNNKITVFTPAFNRAYCLHQVYESLLRQTALDFCWLVVDDGSTDTTKELVETWITENKLDIQYVYQENQGMHGAHNTAYSLITTELNVCIDSDDYMPDDAIELILNFWKIHGNANVAGLVGLDADKNGAIIGSKIPPHIKQSTLGDLYQKQQVTGDKKLVLRTAVVKKHPKYPLFEGERFVPLGTLYMMIDKDYELLCLNKPLCVVEYLADGSSMNIFKQYRRHPKGFAYSRNLRNNFSKSSIDIIKNSIHLISCSLFAKDLSLLFKNKYWFLSIIFLPFGLLLHIYLLLKTS